MAEGFDAGSIFFALRAQIQGVQQNVDSVKRKLDTFGDSVKGTAKTVQASGAQISQTFTEVDRAALQQTQKVSAFTQRLLALQTVVSTLGSGAGQNFSQFRREIDAATIGLQTFATTVALIPSRTGIAVGAISALALVIVKLIAPTQEAIAALNAMTNVTDEIDASLTKLQRTFEKTLEQNIIFGEEILNSAKRLELTRSRVLEIQIELEKIPARLRVLALQIANVSGAEQEALQDQFINLNRLRNLLERDLEEIRLGFDRLKTNAAVEGARNEVEKLSASLQTLTRVGMSAIKEGVVTPIQQARVEFAAAEDAIRKVLILQQQLADQGIKNVNLLNTVIVGFRDTRASAAAEIRRLQAPAEFAAAFAEPLAANIGDAVFQGILEGKEAIDILGDIAQNVFSTALSSAIASFQKGMTNVLTQIAGSAGGIIGNILTGIAGVAAGIFLRRRGSSTNTFSEVESRIESTQAVRGVVAGPTSIPIASVGENLERAFVPVNDRLDIMINHLAAISNNTSSGAAPGGGQFGLAGTVPTS
jgi:hypothetical protein